MLLNGLIMIGSLLGKTKHVIVGQSHSQCEKLTNRKSNIYNCLGAELGSNLWTENHINTCVRQANKKMFLFSKLRRCLSRKTTALLYKQLMRPQLEHCDFLMDTALKT